MKSGERADVQASILIGRRIACICEREAMTVTLGYSDARGITVEYVECRGCWKQYRRVDCE